MSQARPVAAVLLALGACASLAQASASFDVSFDDPAAQYGAYYAELERVTQAAGAAWVAQFADPGFDSILSVSIGFAATATASGRSASAAYIGSAGNGMRLYEQGAAFEFKTGVDSNGSAPDIEFRIGIDGYLQTELWFDPDPALRLAPVPSDRTDAMSVLLHEFGHAFGFSGWRDGSTGALPGNFESSFDALVAVGRTAAGTSLFITGARAQDLYGAPLPMTVGSYAHLGNAGAGAGSNLVPDLMNGVLFYRGTRYDISALDLRVMADLGLPPATPVGEPATAALWAAGLGALAATRRRQRRRTLRGTLLAASVLFALATSAQAQWSVSVGLPSVSIGINVPQFPQLVQVSGYPVYYAPGLPSNYFFYDGMYWVYEGDEWYASTWYDGPWRMTAPEAVPLFVLRVPVRYYRSPPPYFRAWQRDTAPRWGEHWGPSWQSRHHGWERWNRQSAPPPAPLPSYQRQYPGGRYPDIDRQQALHNQNYRYVPREAVVRQHFQEPAPMALPREPQPRQQPPQVQLPENQEQPRQQQPRQQPQAPHQTEQPQQQPQAQPAGSGEGQQQGRGRQQRPYKPDQGQGQGQGRERGDDNEDRGNGRRK